MQVHRLRPIAVLLLCLHLAGCTTWQPVQVSPQQVLESEQPAKVRVTDADGVRVVLSNPVIERDSISGKNARGFPHRSALEGAFVEL